MTYPIESFSMITKLSSVKRRHSSRLSSIPETFTSELLEIIVCNQQTFQSNFQLQGNRNQMFDGKIRIYRAYLYRLSYKTLWCLYHLVNCTSTHYLSSIQHITVIVLIHRWCQRRLQNNMQQSRILAQGTNLKILFLIMMQETGKLLDIVNPFI